MIEQLPFSPPQLQNYMDACWFEGYFSPEEVRQISAVYDATEKKLAETTKEGDVELDFRKSTVAFMKPTEEAHRPFMVKLAQLAIQANQQYFNFDLMGFYEPIQIAEYGAGDFFKWHADFGNGPESVRKLSLSIQLSDAADYEGGDLQFMVNEEGVSAPRTLGTVVIFPSFVLHRVTPITSGKRRSLVGWVSGAPYR